LLGIVNDSSAAVVNTETGDLVARFELTERHESIAFADSDHLYLGSQAGALRVIARDTAGGWTVQTLWQGESPIRLLEASPGSRNLVLVDANNLAQQFSLGEGRIGDNTLQLPGTVSEVTFSPGGMRVLIRTSVWVHRASSSGAGLIWQNSTLAPKALANARIVFGDPERDEAAALGNRFYLPVAADGYPRLAELNFTATRGPGLFGNKDQLLDEWRRKLALVTPESSDE